MAGNPDILDGLAELAKGLPNIYKILMTPLKAGADWLEAGVIPFTKEVIGRTVGGPRNTYVQLLAESAKIAAPVGLPEETIAWLLTVWPIYAQIIHLRESYAPLKAVEYGLKAKWLLEIPTPDSILRAMIHKGESFLEKKDPATALAGMKLFGFNKLARMEMERAARTTLDAATIWRINRRLGKPEGFNAPEEYRRTGLFADQLKWLLYSLPLLPPIDLIARKGWREGLKYEDLEKRMLEAGVSKPRSAEWLGLLESVLPPDLAVRGLWRKEWDNAEALKRIMATGLREDDRAAYIALSTSLLPADLVARGLWRKRDDASTALDRMTALGVDRKDAAEWLIRMQSVMGAGDLARLLYAGQIEENGYVAGLERLGLAPDDALAIGKWPWQPIPSSEALRLHLAGKLGAEDTRRALRTAGMPPEAAEAIVAWPYRATGLGETKLLFNRGLIHSIQAADRLKAGGLRPDDATAISVNLNDPLPPDALFQLLRRGIIDEKAVIADLIRHGYAGDAAERFAKLAWVVPGPGDVVDFAVKDVFEADVVEHFGYAEEFPEEFVTWAKKAGIPRDVAKLYWYAHWYVPGVGEVFNMLHRIKPGQEDVPRKDRETWVTDEDVDMYLKTQDYPPWWRDPLKAISYHPISRIDIRRAYQDGLADEEDVYNTNRALGYSHRDATILTDWTKWAYMPEDEALLLAKVRDGLMDGSLDAAAARSLLTEIDLSADRIDLVLDWAAYEREAAKKDLTRSTVQRLYVDGYIDETDLRTRLAALNYAGEEIELLLALWSIDREAVETVKAVPEARPSRAQVTRFWTRGVIGERGWTEEMTGLGYNSTYIAWFREDLLKDWTEDTLSDYFTKGLLSERSLRAELNRRGWPDEQIDALLVHLRGG